MFKPESSFRRRHAAVDHATRAGLALLAFLVTTSDEAQAQVHSGPRSHWEVVVPSGRLIPTEAQRDAIERGGLTAVQVSYVARPSLAATATLGWARSRDLVTAAHPKVDAFLFDVGAEVRAPRWIARGGLAFSPFAGIGAGARMYNHRSLDVDATHNAAAYGSVGGELGVKRIRLRVEARDYVTAFKPLIGGGASVARNDVVVLVGLRVASR